MQTRAGSGSRWLGRLLAAVGALSLSGVARAAPPPIAIPVSAEDGAAASANEGLLDFLQSWRRNGALLGDMWGARTLLSRYGVSLGVQETSEGLGNVTGGSRRGFTYEGLTQAVVQLNTQRAFGWYGGTLNISALQIHGRNLSAENLGSLQTASGIEADRATRLWEAWYDQRLLDEDRLDLRLGQQSLDQEFMVSSNALSFVNTMFGWPMVPSADLPGGGPAYPLSALGLRARMRPTDAITVLAGVFSGSPAKTLAGDPQRDNRFGLSFPLNKGVLAIAEIQYADPALGGMVAPGADPPLARTYRLGVWYDSAPVADQRFATEHRGDWSVYAVADQMVWRSGRDPNRTLSLFTRIMGTPQADRNLVDFSANLGFVLRDPLPYRTADSFGVGVGYAHVSRRAAGADRDAALATGTYVPARSDETFVEATYQRQITPWLQLQPDVQYVFNPGGGVANPNNPAARTRNELVLGVRTNVLF